LRQRIWPHLPKADGFGDQSRKEYEVKHSANPARMTHGQNKYMQSHKMRSPRSCHVANLCAIAMVAPAMRQPDRQNWNASFQGRRPVEPEPSATRLREPLSHKKSPAIANATAGEIKTGPDAFFGKPLVQIARRDGRQLMAVLALSARYCQPARLALTVLT
jgi:hypothetical protein